MGGAPCWILPRPGGFIVKLAAASEGTSLSSHIGLLSRLGKSIEGMVHVVFFNVVDRGL